MSIGLFVSVVSFESVGLFVPFRSFCVCWIILSNGSFCLLDHLCLFDHLCLLDHLSLGSFVSIGSYVQFGIAGPMAHLYQFGNLWLMGSYIRNRINIMIIETLSYFILLSLSACSI